MTDKQSTALYSAIYEAVMQARIDVSKLYRSGTAVRLDRVDYLIAKIVGRAHADAVQALQPKRKASKP